MYPSGSIAYHISFLFLSETVTSGAKSLARAAAIGTTLLCLHTDDRYSLTTARSAAVTAGNHTASAANRVGFGRERFRVDFSDRRKCIEKITIRIYHPKIVSVSIHNIYICRLVSYCCRRRSCASEFCLQCNNLPGVICDIIVILTGKQGFRNTQLCICPIYF